MASSGERRGQGCSEYEECVVPYLCREDVVEVAEKCQVVWAKVGSYPHWPAQIISDEAVEARDNVKHCRRPKDAVIPVMFFGEMTFAWMKEKALLSWSDGISKGIMIRKNDAIRHGIRQVKTFLSSRETLVETAEARTAALEGWWCSVPLVVEHPWPCKPDVVERGEEIENLISETGNLEEEKPVPCIPIGEQGKMKLTSGMRHKLLRRFGEDSFKGRNDFPEYIHTNRNIWMVPRPKKFKSLEDVSVCNCFPVPAVVQEYGAAKDEENRPVNVPLDSTLVGCGADCLNRISCMHCDTSHCPCGKLCQNKPFHKLSMPPMDVFLTESKGWGVRASQFLPAGSFVAEYTGEVIDQEEMARRMEEARSQGLPHFYMMEMSPGLIIDARLKGNIARLLNSSCNPNCITQKWRDASTGEIRVGIFTKKDVPAGEELVYDYNFEHIMEGGGLKYTCQCGAHNCRGSMETTQRHSSRDVGRRIEIWWDGDECYYSGVLSKYDNVTGKYTVMYDDGMVESILLTEHKHRWNDVGRRIEIWWEEDSCHYPGVLEEYHEDTGEYSILYDDGMMERIVLTEHEHRWIDRKNPKRRRLGREDSGSRSETVVPMPTELSEAIDTILREADEQTLRYVHACINKPRDEVALVDSLMDSSEVPTLCSMLDSWFSQISGDQKSAELSKMNNMIAEAMEQQTAMPPPDILEPVDNPGAEQTAGSLHGNGNPKEAPASVSSRGRKRQKKIFGNDFEQDMESLQPTRPRGADISSPVREKPRATAKQTPMSPGMEAASIIAQIANSKPEEKRGKSRSTFRGSGPTPPSSGLPARTILVAKRLTNSDVTKGRILLPRAAVEANLSFAVGRAHSLVARDHEGNSWEFTLQSWANGIETRRVFVLEHAGDYIRYHTLKIEDVIGISTTEQGEFMVEFNTDEVCAAAESQQAARAGGQLVVNTSLPAIRPGSINPLIQQNSGRCTRSVHCNKPAGHPGFCMRTPAATRGKPKGVPAPRGRGVRGGRGRGKRLPLVHNPYVYSNRDSKDVYSNGDDDDESDESDPDSEQPGSARFGRHGGDSGDDDIFRRGGVLTPRFPNSSYEYFGKSENEFDDGYSGEGTHHQEKPASKEPGTSRGNPLPKYPLPPPPELGPGVPPIFVMAQDSAPQYPPQLRSPLRPSIQGRPRSQTEQQVPPIPNSPSAAIANLPNMGLKDDVEGVSPHAFNAHQGGGGGNTDYLSVLEGASPSFATTIGQKGPFSAGMPAAPLPLFGAPPPPLGTSHGRGTTSQSMQETHIKDKQTEFDYASFLNKTA